MKQLLWLLLWLPAAAFSQRDKSFGKFTNADGATVKGSSQARGYERQIEVYNLSASSANNNTTVAFSMPVSPATAAFRDAANSNKPLRTGEIVVLVPAGDVEKLSYKINLEEVVVVECVDNNNITKVQLRATRIGWTYYSTSIIGSTTVATKTGWDAGAKKAWSGF
ncbi:type VI secretion system tube protein Hcp [Paraflavitalea pollutisoli]|uniref:type VI secretion system tube protein Hcp n=1 Tax=Paraflavitalea pollutisoli TaxID=3034143 RepID=UPI0023EBEE5C|nr:type VI secretion system tube protein Hcp [Paraflavitalea sp. H1-2-19X]